MTLNRPDIAPSTVRLLEQCEMDAWMDLVQAAPSDVVAKCRIASAEIGGICCTAVGSTDTLALNRIVGPGLSCDVEAEALDHMIDLFRQSGSPRLFVQINPLARCDRLIGLLKERGFYHYNNWVKLYRDLSPPPSIRSDLEVRPLKKGDAEAFAEVVCGGFEWPDAIRPWIAEVVERPRWHCYGAFDGEMLVATGAFCVCGEQAWLDLTATIKDFRGQGAQGALLARRIEDCNVAGVGTLVVETAEQTPGKEAPSYRNMRRFGFRHAYARPNFLLNLK